MSSTTNQAMKLAQEGKIYWAMPLIKNIESRKKHSAIKWVLQIVKELLLEGDMEPQTQYIDWLNELASIIELEIYDDINYLRDKGKEIFTPSSGRNIYSVLISRLYTSEGYYRLDKHASHIRFLWDILDHVNEKFGDSDSYTYRSIINDFPPPA